MHQNYVGPLQMNEVGTLKYLNQADKKEIK